MSKEIKHGENFPLPSPNTFFKLVKKNIEKNYDHCDHVLEGLYVKKHANQL